MKTNNNQAGFAHVVLVLLVIVVAVVGFAGYSVYNNQQGKTNTASNGQSANDETVASDVPSAPEIKSTSDLDKASATLDQVDVDGSNGSDSTQLDSQLTSF